MARFFAKKKFFVIILMNSLIVIKIINQWYFPPIEHLCNDGYGAPLFSFGGFHVDAHWRNWFYPKDWQCVRFMDPQNDFLLRFSCLLYTSCNSYLHSFSCSPHWRRCSGCLWRIWNVHLLYIKEVKEKLLIFFVHSIFNNRCWLVGKWTWAFGFFVLFVILVHIYFFNLHT